MEELQELLEMNPRNNLNLCLSGGMTELLSIALGHPSDELRVKACSIISSVSADNKQVQEFAVRSGALNLVYRVNAEENIRNKEAAFGALSSLLRAEGFEGKRRFIA